MFGERFTVDQSPFWTLQPAAQCRVIHQVHRPVGWPAGTKVVREVYSLRFVDRVEFIHIEVLPRARWEAAFGDVDVQVEAAIRSGALSK